VDLLVRILRIDAVDQMVQYSSFLSIWKVYAMSIESTNHVSNATDLFERRRYAECMHFALEALGIYEEDEHWLMASATLVLYGRCSNAVGAYLQANNAFRQALRLLRKVRHTDAEVAIITGYIEQSNSDEVSKDEVQRLRDRVEALSAEFEFDSADELVAKELERAAKNCSPRDWYVAMVKVVQAMAKVNRANALLDGADGVGEAMAMLEECRRLYSEASALAGQPENLERAYWLIGFIDDLRAQVDSVIKAVQQAQNGASEFDADGEYVGEQADEFTSPAQTARPASTPRQLRSWTEPFAEVNVELSGNARVYAAMAPADELFIRGEYRQCIRDVRPLVAKSKEAGNWVLGAMGLVLIARCQRALGMYSDAVTMLEESSLWLRRDTTLGTRMLPSVAKLGVAVSADVETYAALNDTFGKCQALAEQGQFADAADLASHGLRQQSTHLSAQHWVCGSFKALKAGYLIEQRRATAGGESPRDQDADESVVDEARTLLKEADKLVAAHGHDAAWVGATVHRVRDNLYRLCDEAGL
jgi:tetratricopeptide (TPR) repeat protein